MSSGLLRESAVFSVSRYALLGLSFIRNFVVARALDPEQYGYWVIVMLVLTYGDQIHLGLRHAGDKEIPYYRGRGQPEEARRIADTLYAGILLISVAALVILGSITAVAPGGERTVQGVIVVAGVIVVVEQVNRYYLMIMRATKQFILSSKVEIAVEAARTTLVCVLVYLFSLAGAITGFLAAAVIMTVFFVFRFRTQFVPRFDWRRLRKLLQLGISLFGVSLLYVLLINADRLFGATVLSKVELGVYGIAALAAQLPLNFTQGISSVVYPTLSEQFGRSDSLEHVFPVFSNVLRSLAFAVPLIVVTTYFGASILVEWFLPAYRQSLEVLILLLPGVFLLAFVPLLSGVFTAVNRARHFLLLEIVAVVCALILFPVLKSLLEGPRGIGVAMSSSMVIYAGLALISTLYLFSVNPRRVLKELAATCLPSIYCLALVVAVLQVGGAESNLTRILMQYGLFLLGSIPLIIVAHRVLDLRKVWRLLRASNA